MSTIRTIDPGVIPMVKFFNENGLPTHMSCQGHNRIEPIYVLDRV